MQLLKMIESLLTYPVLYFVSRYGLYFHFHRLTSNPRGLLVSSESTKIVAHFSVRVRSGLSKGDSLLLTPNHYIFTFKEHVTLTINTTNICINIHIYKYCNELFLKRRFF